MTPEDRAKLVFNEHEFTWREGDRSHQEALIAATIRGAVRAALAPLIRQIESADYRHPESGSPLVNNVHFIKAKEAVGE